MKAVLLLGLLSLACASALAQQPASPAQGRAAGATRDLRPLGVDG